MTQQTSSEKVWALTLLPASIGTCKNFPEATLVDGRASMKVPGGPTVGCQSWLLILALVSIVVALCRACRSLVVSSSRVVAVSWDVPRTQHPANMQKKQALRDIRPSSTNWHTVGLAGRILQVQVRFCLKATPQLSTECISETQNSRTKGPSRNRIWQL